MSDSNDKLYIIVIIGMIFFFIYWYQTRLDRRLPMDDAKKSDVCKMCSKTLKTTKKKEHKNQLKQRNHQKHKIKKKSICKQKTDEKIKKNVRFNSEEQHE